MKKLLLSAIMVFTAVFAFTQSLEIYHEGELVPNKSSIVVTGDVGAAELMIEVDVKNISNTGLDVKVSKFEVDLIPGSSNTFCWGMCFPPNTYVSPFPQTILPGATCSEFSGHYNPNANSGVSIIRYTFFDMNNPTDTVCFYTEFNAGTVGINDATSEKARVSNAYPNPASGSTSVDYVLPATASKASIKVRNLLGSLVREVKLTERAGTATIDLNGLNDGVYFYSFVVNNQTVETKRLVVSH
jgi:hypothetical protein